MSKSTEQVPTLKVVLLGDLGVGKTCLRSQYVHHVSTNAYKATIGGDYLTTTVIIPKIEDLSEDTAALGDATIGAPDSVSPDPASQKVNLQIWDTAGQERFNSISQAFYRGADVCVLVYDITNYESVLSIRDWFSRFMEHCHVPNPGVIIVGNKTDRKLERCVNMNELKDILTAHSNRLNINDYVNDWTEDLIEVSSKKLDLVSEVFARVARVGVHNIEGTAVRRRIQGFDSIDLSAGGVIQGGCGC